MGKYGLRAKWLSVASFEFEKDGHHIVTDPFITLNGNSRCTWEDVEGCDLFTLSHVHWDHITDIPVLMRKFPAAPLLTGTLSALPLCTWGNLIPQDVWPMDANLEVDFDWVKVKALLGRHVPLGGDSANQLESRLRKHSFVDRAMGDMQILGTLEYRNFLFTFPDGVKMFVWGNGFTPVQKNIVKELQPDIAVLQVTNQMYNVEGFVEFVKLSGAKVVIPHHMDLSKPYEEYIPQLKIVKEAIEKEIPGCKLVIPEEHGVWMDL